MALDIRWINDRIAVAPQIEAGDMAEIARHGFAAIINNRPDGEEAGQLAAADAEAAARAVGLSYAYLPVTADTMTDQAVDTFAWILDENQGPVLAHCRSGTRSCVLWALAEAKTGRAGPDQILQAAGAAGYDLSPYRSRLAAYANSVG